MTTHTNQAPLVIEPSQHAQSAIIWLHGLGANAHDFEGIVPMLQTEKYNTRVIFPNAPVRPVTLNMGMEMQAWYDITDITFRNADKTGINNSAVYIQSLIDEQIALGIPSKKIVLAGFSQGGAMALHTGLRCSHALAGILALSCYVLEYENHSEQVNHANQHTPILMAHGTQDPVVAYDLGQRSSEFLLSHQHKLTFKTYQMAHEVIIPEILDLSDWILDVLE